MNNRLRSTVALTLPALVLALTLAFASIGLAGALKKGGTYSGTTVRDKQPISLKVSRSGKTVTTSIAFAPQFCENGGAVGSLQLTKPATISKSGSFQAKITYEFTPTHAIIATLTISGKFSGKSVTGRTTSAFTSAKQCNGTTSFSAKAK